MTNLNTSYMGIPLKNPVIVGSCNLSTDDKLLKKMEEAGAAAIVFKSLFEEQIQLENLKMSNQLDEFNERHAEMTKLFPNIDHAGPEEYLFNLARAVKMVNIPVFASLNAVNPETWVEYAQKIEEMGVAGIELNFYADPAGSEISGEAIIETQVDVAKAVVQSVKIPVAVKLSSFYTNIPNVVKRFDNVGVKGFVLFNRLFQPDFDLEREIHHFPYNLSHPEDNRLPLRFTGLLYGNVKGSLCANTGIFSGHDVVRMILAGANAVQVVSTLYKNRVDVIADILSQVEQWMQTKHYGSLDDFRGKLSAMKSTDMFAYKRAQYIDILMKSDEIFRNYPTV
jgi:dihydroorotate dehydrogenase (fumarate)